MKKFVSVFLPIVLLAASCGTATVESDKVDESTYFREFGVTFDENTLKSRAEAQFSVSGFHHNLDSATTIELVEPSAIKINEKKTKFFDAREHTDLLGKGSYYYLDLGNDRKSVKFTWIKKDGSTDQQVVSAPEEIALTFPVDGAKINKNKHVKFKFAGPPLGKKEFIRISINVEKPDDASPIPGDQRTTYISDIFDSLDNVFFSADDAKYLRTGKAKLYLSRHYLAKNGQILKESTYIARDFNVTITN